MSEPTTEAGRPPGYPYGEFDAQKWAEEFDRIFPDTRPDTMTMLGWFANAIMTGYDKAQREAEARRPALDVERLLAGLAESDTTDSNDFTRGFDAAIQQVRAALDAAREDGS